MSRFSRTREKTAVARKLRKAVSKTEARLWLYLRNNQCGAPFRRQRPIGPYFADYYCAPLKIVVEVDGYGHDAAYDARRDAFMEGEGICVLRFTSEEVAFGIEGVVMRIRDAVRMRRWVLENLE